MADVEAEIARLQAELARKKQEADLMRQNQPGWDDYDDEDSGTSFYEEEIIEEYSESEWAEEEVVDETEITEEEVVEDVHYAPPPPAPTIRAAPVVETNRSSIAAAAAAAAARRTVITPPPSVPQAATTRVVTPTTTAVTPQTALTNRTSIAAAAAAAAVARNAVSSETASSKTPTRILTPSPPVPGPTGAPNHSSIAAAAAAAAAARKPNSTAASLPQATPAPATRVAGGGQPSWATNQKSKIKKTAAPIITTSSSPAPAVVSQQPNTVAQVHPTKAGLAAAAAAAAAAKTRPAQAAPSPAPTRVVTSPAPSPSQRAAAPALSHPASVAAAVASRAAATKVAMSAPPTPEETLPTTSAPAASSQPGIKPVPRAKGKVRPPPSAGGQTVVKNAAPPAPVEKPKGPRIRVINWGANRRSNEAIQAAVQPNFKPGKPGETTAGEPPKVKRNYVIPKNIPPIPGAEPKVAEVGPSPCGYKRRQIPDDPVSPPGAETLWEILLGPKLICNSKLQKKSTVGCMKDQELIGLYFGCKMKRECKQFHPKLQDFYFSTACQQNLEIVYISSDRTLAEFKELFAKMPYLALGGGTAKYKNFLSQTLKIIDQPTLVILDDDGMVVTVDAAPQIMALERGNCAQANALVDRWKKTRPIPMDQVQRDFALQHGKLQRGILYWQE